MRRIERARPAAALSALALVLAACGGADDEPDTDTDADTATEEATEPEDTTEAEETEPEAEEADDGSEAAGFPEREVKLITRGSPGGGHDEFTRAIAGVMEDELGVTVLVENMTGGAGVLAADYMRSSAPKDGYELHLMDPVGLLGTYIAENEDFDFDADFDFPFLGTVTQRATAYAVAADSDIEDWDQFVEELQGGNLAWAITGFGSPHVSNTAVLFDELGIPQPTFVPHEGSAEAFTALLRGDADFVVQSNDAVAPHIESGDLRGLIHFSGEPMEDLLPGVPRGEDVGLEDYDGLLSTSLALVAAPGTPEPILEVLRDATESVFFSDELAQWGEEADRIVAPLDAADTEAQLRGVVDLYQEYRPAILELTGQG